MSQLKNNWNDCRLNKQKKSSYAPLSRSGLWRFSTRSEGTLLAP